MMLCDKGNCTGCTACLSVCRQEAIKMKQDEFGFLHPSIDTQKCVGCGMCAAVCPELTPVKLRTAEGSCAAVAKDAKVRKSSTSGGAAQVFSEYILKHGGIVYGHGFNSEQELVCMRITSSEELACVNGTKYVQSNMGDAICKIKKDLSMGRRVLFVGTPCQAAGVTNAIRNRTNLIVVSFVCGGVPSPVFLREYLADVGLDKKATRIQFRRNEEYGLFLNDNDEGKCVEERWKSPYFMGFDEHAIQRESCYICRYAQPARVGDITIGDYWGLKSEVLDAGEKCQGVSLVIATSEAGEQLMNACVEDGLMYAEQHSFAEATKENPRLISPVVRTKQVDVFRTYYVKNGFVKTIRNMYGWRYAIYRIKRTIKKIKILDAIYHSVKR